MRVGHRLLGGEGLRRDDEQRLLGVKTHHRLGEVGAIDVGDEAEGQIAAAVVLERLVGHHRAEVGAADADVDDILDRLAGVSQPPALAHVVAERAHPIQHLVNLRHDVDPVDHQRRPAGIRSATCSTARSSVVLMCSPANMEAK